jgi:hypothetical protein
MHLSKFKNCNKPWITEYFKQLISRHDFAFTAGSTVLYWKLRNQVVRMRKSLKSQY